MGIFKSDPTDEVVKKLFNTFEDIDGLKEILCHILDLENSKIYEKLVNTNFKNIIDENVELRYHEKSSEIVELARKDLSRIRIHSPVTPLISIRDFYVVYTFIGHIYYINLNHKLNREELDKIEMGSMANKLLLAPKDFDSIKDVPKPSPDFFKKLGKIKWKDKKTKKLFNEITKFHFILAFNKWGGKNVEWDFPATEKAFIGLLSACNTALDHRDKIIAADIIQAEKTYLKLIDTDLTKLM